MTPPTMAGWNLLRFVLELAALIGLAAAAWNSGRARAVGSSR